MVLTIINMTDIILKHLWCKILKKLFNNYKTHINFLKKFLKGVDKLKNRCYNIKVARVLRQWTKKSKQW